MKKISVIIPAYNEEEGIGHAIKLIPVTELAQKGYETEVIVVDNASSDRTGDIARAQGARVILQPIRGYGSAYQAGFAHATGDIIVTGDADVTYPFDAIPALIETLETNQLDFLNTDRLSFLEGDGMRANRVFGNWVLSLVTKVLFGWPFVDSQSGMWVFRRSILNSLVVTSRGMPFSQEIKVEAYTRGFRCGEVPIQYRQRVGEVKLNPVRDGIRNILHLFVKRFALLTVRAEKRPVRVLHTSTS
jgi:glycosyltransferase involved in cell wall biosynthesis